MIGVDFHNVERVWALRLFDADRLGKSMVAVFMAAKNAVGS